MDKHFILYANFLKRHLDLQKPLKVVFDCSNGATGIVLKSLKTKSYKLEAILINSNPDGNFPAHSPNPTIEGVKSQLQKAVLKNKAGLGVIFDGDGDRAFFIDNLGRPIDTDVIAYLLIWHFKAEKALVDLITGWLVKRIAKEELGVKIIESRVGHYFMKKLMRRKNLEFGAERSGHYYFKNFFGLDSGIMTAIEVVNAVSKLPYSLSDFADLLGGFFYNTGEVNFKFSGNKEKLFKIFEQKYEKSASRVSCLDGLLMEFDSPAGSWWFNVRFSNTEPLLRLNLEAEKREVLKSRFQEVIKLINMIK